MKTYTGRWVDDTSFHNDVAYIESCWQRAIIGTSELPLIDLGKGDPLVFVPILEHFEFVYARQIQTLSQSRRVVLYRRSEMRTREIGRGDRVEELRLLLDGLELECPDLIGHGSAAIVLLEFALRYPHRCRSLIILGQGADYRITPYPLVRLLQELYIRLPIEHVLPASLLRRIIIDYLAAYSDGNQAIAALPRHLIEEQLCKIYQWPSVCKYSVLPVLYNFDVRKQIQTLQMPVLLINRADDPLAPESSTRWLAENLPYCAGYHIVPGRERYFTYAQAEIVTSLIESFLASRDTIGGPLRQLPQ